MQIANGLPFSDIMASLIITPGQLSRRADFYHQLGQLTGAGLGLVQALAAQYGVRAIPTLLLFHQGQVADQMVGLRSKRDLKASFDRVTA